MSRSFQFLLLPLTALASCGPHTLPPTDHPELLPIAAIRVGTEITPDNEAEGRPPVAVREALLPLATHRVTAEGLSLTLVTFDARRHRLRVLDNESGPGTGAESSKEAASTLGGVAAINGGFFTPEGEPLGLVIEDGTPFGSLNRSSLGAGVFRNDSDRSLPSLARRGGESPRTKVRDLLQSGPFLLEDGKAVRGLSTARPRERSFLLWDGAAGWALGHASSSTLASLSDALATQPVPGFTIRHALNLDGGSSSDLWISPSVKGGPVSTRRFWNKDVRNHLVLTPLH